MELRVALVGNPNVGKTSLYNRLTRSFEHVGNWHGVTVKRVAKRVDFEGNSLYIEDLPGLYSLSVCSLEEAVARDSVLKGDYDVIINVCEVNNLTRNLYLTMQLLELDVPVVLVVNMIDELTKRGEALDCQRLASRLSIPVLPLSAKYKVDAKGLIDVCRAQAASFVKNKSKLAYINGLPIERIVTIAGEGISKSGITPSFAAIKLLENDSFIMNKLSAKERDALPSNFNYQAKVAALRYEYIEKITGGIIVSKQAKAYKKRDYLDKIILNKYLSLPIFLCVMITIFAITFGLIGRWMSDGLGHLVDRYVYIPVEAGLESAGVWRWLIALVCEGVINGVGGILVFLPQIVLLFFFLALLEDSGYISRVAFMTDGLFSKIGLSGRSAFTMLMGFGCSATAVLTSRGLDDDKMRKKTVLLTPFMSCSARLPVYSAIGGAFFLGANPLIIFMLYVLGAVVALTLAAAMQRSARLKSGKPSFIMEMPPYRLPTIERVSQLIQNNAKVFLIRVGTVVFGLNVIVWCLANFSARGYTSGTEYQSFLETFSTIIAPLFAPLGFGSWQSVSALLSGLIAKEAVLGAIESLGGTEVIFAGQGDWVSALCFLVFVLLYVPCLATLGAIAKEIGAKWALASFVTQILIAYFVALIVRVVCLLFINNSSLALGLSILLLISLATIASIKHALRAKQCRACQASKACTTISLSKR